LILRELGEEIACEAIWLVVNCQEKLLVLAFLGFLAVLEEWCLMALLRFQDIPRILLDKLLEQVADHSDY